MGLNLDQNVFFALNNLAGESVLLDAFFVFLAKYLPYLIGALAFALWLNWKENWILKIKIASVFIIIGGLAYASAFLFFHEIWPRPRPFEVISATQLISETGFSFPSKHALISFILATFILKINRKAGRAFFVVAILISLGRVFVGVHYPSDILVGAFLGILVGWAGVVLAEKFLKLKVYDK